MNISGKKQKVIVFTCNWQAYSSLEAAGIEGLGYSASVIPIRLSCLGRLSPGIILKAFEGGAAGVCLVGCAEGECRYQNGNIEAREVFKEARNLLKLLGTNENLLQYHLINAGNGSDYVNIMDSLMKTIEKDRGKL